MLAGALIALIVILAFVLGSVYGKSIKIEVLKPEEPEQFLEQPRTVDPEVENYINQNGGFNF